MSSYDYLINTPRAKENAKKDKELGTNAPTNSSPEQWAAGYELSEQAAKRALDETVNTKKALDAMAKAQEQQATQEAAEPVSKGDDRSER